MYCESVTRAATGFRESAGKDARRRARTGACALAMVITVVGALPAGAAGEPASDPPAPAAGRLDAGAYHSCAVLDDGSLRCWGFNADGQLGYGNTNTIGDDETPGSVGPVNFGPGRTVKAISAGDYHTCAVLDDGSVRCWGYGGDGRLGYGNTNNVTDPRSVGPVDLGPGRTATAISAGAGHTCAVLDDGSVRCWGYGGDGRLGYGNTNNVTDPGPVGPVDLGQGRTAKAVTAGSAHTCALLDNGTVRCWGYAYDGNLGYSNTKNVGDNKTPGAVGPVDLGAGRTAKAITAGQRHTCALLDNGSVRCWGYGLDGRLGYGNTDAIGDNETPGSVGPVDLGAGRTAKALTAGTAHTCAVLDDGSVRCWGNGGNGRLGYGDLMDIGDNEAPGSAGPVDLGPERTATAITAGGAHTCARLDNGSVLCWGDGSNGQLGYCNQDSIGDDESPGFAGAVSLAPGDNGAVCAVGSGSSSGSAPATQVQQAAVKPSFDPTVAAKARRAQGLRGCLAAVTSHAKRERRAARHGSARHRAAVRRHLSRHARRGRRRCFTRYGRTPKHLAAQRRYAPSSHSPSAQRGQ